MKKKSHDRRAQKRRERKKHQRSVRTKPSSRRQPSTRINEYAALLAGHPSAHPDLVGRLKAEPCDVLRDLLRQSHPPGKNWTGTQFARTYNSFGRQLPISPALCLEDELRWSALVLSLFATELTAFVAAKRTFDARLLLGDYSGAQKAYNDGIQAVGFSLWSIEAGFLLAEYQGGLQANRQFLQDTLAWRPNPLPSIAATHFSLRVERRVSADSYLASVRELIANVAPGGPVGIPEYFACRLGTETLKLSLDFGKIVYIDSVNTIADRYLLFVKIIQSLAAKHSLGTVTREAVSDSIRELDAVSDNRLRFLRHLIHPSIHGQPSALENTLMTTIDKYTVGDYQGAAAIAAAGLTKHPESLELYKLYAKSCLYLGTDPPPVFPLGTLADSILRDVEAVLGRKRDVRGSSDSLRKFGYELDSLDIGRQIQCFVEDRAGRGNQELNRLDLVVQALRTPRCAELFLSTKDADQYLDASEADFKANAGISLFRAVVDRTTSILTKIPTTRRLQYEARRLFASGEIRLATEKYQQLLRSAGGVSLVREAAVAGLYECYIALERVSDALTLLIDVYTNWPQVLTGLEVTRLLDRYDDEHRNSGDIRWPMIAFLAYGRTSAYGQEQLADFLEDYLVANGVERPSQLLQHQSVHNTQLLTTLLREICVPSVIDFSVAYENSDDLDSERLAICQALRQLDQMNSEAYAAEAAALTHTMALRQVIQTVTQSKLQVDVSAIASGLDGVFWERLARYQDFLSLAAALRKEVSLGPGDKDVDLLLVLADNKVVDVKDSAERQFAQIFSEVRKAFLFGESGLDTQLSVRIRHGTLQGQLRSQFESEYLMTRIGRTPGQYGENVHWRQKVFQALGAKCERKADLQLREFSAEVDSVISLVKDGWLQIRGLDKPDGLFDFDYKVAELRVLYNTLGRESEPKALVSGLLNEFTGRTEKSIQKLIERLRGDLNDRLIAALDRLAVSAFAIDLSVEHSDFGKAIARCRTRVGNCLETVCAWFRTSENASAPDVNPALVVRTGVEVVRRGFPGVEFSPMLELAEIGQISGRYLRAVNDVLFILLENVMKHGLASGSKISLERVGDFIRLSVDNSLPTDADPKVIADAISAIPQGEGTVARPGAASGEGKSGYHKLHTILRYGLGCGDDYSVVVRINGSTFMSTVKFRAEGVTC